MITYKIHNLQGQVEMHDKDVTFYMQLFVYIRYVFCI